ncbi:MAG: three component ABC system middle component, partial [Anaerovoracaceae bacterium]
IETLSLNPHFFKQLIGAFLTGYGKPCDLKLVFMVLPILLYAPSREKLENANSRSKLESLFNTKFEIEAQNLSGKARLSGFFSRYQMLEDATKKTIIILHSQGDIKISGTLITATRTVQYSIFKNKIKAWMKAAHYLGVIFSNDDVGHISYFLGVE